MGEIAALGTSLFWSLTSIQFTLAGRRIGSPVVNRVRLLAAALNLLLIHLLVQRELLPVEAEPARWGWLGLSAVIGLVLGDGALFQAFLLIGPRLSMLLMTLAPVIGASIAWLWLGETLDAVAIGAMALTIGGVAWVVTERRPAAGEPPTKRDRTFALGVLLGLVGALGQALGLVLSKQGLMGGFSTLSAALIRMLVATAAIWLFALIRGQAAATWQALSDRRALLFALGGAVTGPTLGVWLSMVAVQGTQVGIASTLMALPPVLLIPLARWIFREPITLRAVIGTLIALIGVTIIFLT